VVNVARASNSPSRPLRQGVNVALMREGAGGTYFQGNAFVNQQQGTFEFKDVPPGPYVLTAAAWDRGRQYSGRQLLNVGNSDINGVTLTVGPGSDLTGRLKVENAPPGDPPNLANMQVFLQPQEEQQGGAGAGPVDKTGNFHLVSVPDGPYSLNVANMPPDFYLKSARLAGTDVLDGGLTCDQASSAGGLDLVISGDGGRIEGVVTHDDKPFPGALVVLVPDENHRSQERLYSTSGTDSNGRFTLQSIPPGNYSLFAWEQADEGQYADPDFLRSYEDRGKAVEVDPHGRLTVNLDLIPNRHENPKN